jgi:hypothetical protein
MRKIVDRVWLLCSEDERLLVGRGMTRAAGLTVVVVAAAVLSGAVPRLCEAEEIVLDWTADGVRNFTGSPLRVKVGDKLKFLCHSHNYSNFIYVEHWEQYEACNSSAKDGRIFKGGDCLGQHSARSFSQTIQTRSGGGEPAFVDYLPGNYFYFFSSSDGTLPTTLPSDPPFIGGQCLDGLKMYIYVTQPPQPSKAVVGPTDTPASSPPPGAKDPGGTGSKPGGGLSTAIVAAAAAGVGGLLMVLILSVVAAVVCVVKSSSRRTDLEIARAPESASLDKDEMVNGKSVVVTMSPPPADIKQSPTVGSPPTTTSTFHPDRGGDDGGGKQGAPRRGSRGARKGKTASTNAGSSGGKGRASASTSAAAGARNNSVSQRQKPPSTTSRTPVRPAPKAGADPSTEAGRKPTLSGSTQTGRSTGRVQGRPTAGRAGSVTKPKTPTGSAPTGQQKSSTNRAPSTTTATSRKTEPKKNTKKEPQQSIGDFNIGYT